MNGKYFSSGWKKRPSFSSDWKLFFQWLENFPRAALALARGAGAWQSAGMISWEQLSRTLVLPGLRGFLEIAVLAAII